MPPRTGARWWRTRPSISSISARRTIPTRRSQSKPPRQGKAILCEKPLALNVRQGEEMVAAAKKARVVNMICHNYRRIPAIALAQKMIAEGALGDRIYHFRARYAQDWIADPAFPLVWRLQSKIAGSGAHGDIDAHIIDLGRYLLGEIKEVCGLMETFVKERPLQEQAGGGLAASGGGKMGEVTVDDAVSWIGRFKNGAMANMEATRFAQGRKNHISLEINGSKGSLAFDFEDMNRLSLLQRGGSRGPARLPQHPGDRGQPAVAGAWWPPGHIIGYEHTFVNAFADFVKAVVSGKSVQPTFEDGLRNERVLAAIGESARSRQWVKRSLTPSLYNLMTTPDNRIAIVTGAGRGIGEAIARRLGSQGMRIACVSRTESNARQSRRGLERKPRPIPPAPMPWMPADRKAVLELCERILADFGRVDILVNNAGLTRDGLAMRMSEEDWDLVMDTNLKGAFNFIQGVMRPMIKQRAGRIINISSVSGLTGNAGQANYAASKAGLIGLTKTLARELSSRGITVNAVAPGFITTDMTERLARNIKDRRHPANPAGPFRRAGRYRRRRRLPRRRGGELYHRPDADGGWRHGDVIQTLLPFLILFNLSYHIF